MSALAERENGYESDANHTLSGVDFDEWMREHGVLDCDPESMDEQYDSDSDDSDESPEDIQKAWQSACREWQEADDELVCVDSTDEDEDEDELHDSVDMTEMFVKAVSEEPHEEKAQNRAAVDAMMLLANAMEEQDRSYQRPPLPLSAGCEQSFASMAQNIMESLERSMMLTNEVSAACEHALAEQPTEDRGVQTEATSEPETRQAEELAKLLAEAYSALKAKDRQISEMAEKCADLEQTKKALFVARSQSVGELEKINAELTRQCTELKTQLALAQSREQVLLGTNQMLEAQLNDGLQLLRAKKPAATVHSKSSKRTNEKACEGTNTKRRRVKGGDRQPLGELDQIIINAGKFAQERRHSPQNTPVIPACQPVTPRVNLQPAAAPLTAPVQRHTRPVWLWKK
ncbi:hypothetical protein LPJ78_004816 [Coemansia sp. RSA 989]|nr:hypothetical protein LPJ68_004491 [Coemansia sp. RSA 1086]KAJ1862287.1 hypothetical protein LPJ78_004816 [Coemansia sp. RSA 989]KAJ1870076.1 hypothetical protein LPJ55_004929 [Coemansia sp. RSA 990]KAJ2667994.1 hypothetical protein IWW42_005544 [Coemansia sp. RSA 1085]